MGTHSQIQLRLLAAKAAAGNRRPPTRDIVGEVVEVILAGAVSVKNDWMRVVGGIVSLKLHTLMNRLHL